MREDIKRRNFVKYAAGMAGSAALAGCTGGEATPTATQGDDGGGSDGGGNGDGGGETEADPLANGERPLKYLTIAPFATDPQKEKFESTHDIELERTVAAQAATQQKMHAGGHESHDMGAYDASIAGDLLFESDPPLLQRVPTDGLSRWDNDTITDLFTNPEERVPQLGDQVKDINRFVWGSEDPDSRDELALPPFNYNFDAIGSNPKFVEPEQTATWGMMFDEQYQGKVTIQTTTPHSILETISFLMDTGQMEEDVGSMNNPSEDQLDQAIDFLVKQKNAGQFRSTWTQYGEGVNLMANEEAIIGDIWQPVVLSVRRQGTPCHYHLMDDGIQGFRFWYGGINPTNPGASDRNNVDEVHAFLDMHYGAWYPGFVQGTFGFFVPHYQNEELVRDGEDETGTGMGPEYYDWAHNGKATYEPIDAPYTFDPLSYDWSMEEGEPDPEGATRDAGTIEEKISRTRFYQIWPDTGQYMLDRWKDFLNA